MADRIRVTWATNGDTQSIAVDTLVDGTVSFEEGFGSDYSIADTTDPNRKTIPRLTFNRLMEITTDNIREWQEQTYPEHITASNNNGSAFGYPIGARVVSGGDVWESTVENNVTVPGPGTSWLNVSDVRNYIPTGFLLARTGSDWGLSQAPADFTVSQTATNITITPPTGYFDNLFIFGSVSIASVGGMASGAQIFTINALGTSITIEARDRNTGAIINPNDASIEDTTLVVILVPFNTSNLVI